MTTSIYKLALNEDNTTIAVNISSKSPSNYLIHSIIIDKAENVTIDTGKPVPSADPTLVISSEDVIDINNTQLSFNTVLTINNISDSLLYVFVYYAAISEPTVILPFHTEYFCTYNLYSYVKNYILISRKLTPNNPTPPELIDLIILRKTLEYAIINGDFLKAEEYFNKIKLYYV